MIKYIFCPIFLHNCTTCNIVTCNSLFQHNDCSLPIDFLQDLEDLDEEVDDVQVELDGCEDVLLGAESGHDHLGVHDDEHGEEEGAANSESSVSHLVTCIMIKPHDFVELFQFGIKLYLIKDGP